MQNKMRTWDYLPDLVTSTVHKQMELKDDSAMPYKKLNFHMLPLETGKIKL